MHKVALYNYINWINKKKCLCYKALTVIKESL